MDYAKAQFVRLVESVMQWAGCTWFPTSRSAAGLDRARPRGVPALAGAGDGDEGSRLRDRARSPPATSGRYRRRRWFRANASSEPVAELAQFVDDFLRYPAEVAAPVATAGASLNPDGLRAATLLVSAGRFHAAAERPSTAMCSSRTSQRQRTACSKRACAGCPDALAGTRHHREDRHRDRRDGAANDFVR